MKNREAYNVPILLIIFNRPETTSRVFAALRKVKPSRIYISADGPRTEISGERKRCEDARKITEKINWPCTVRRRYQSKNLGCGRAVSSAINWFFENESEGIVLEDDCLPNDSFFLFCKDALARYRNDESIMHISGNNFLKRPRSESLYLSLRYPHVWGWATWRRAWKKYDYNMQSWKRLNLGAKLSSLKGNIWTRFYWTAMFDSVAYKIIDTWDYQWTYAVLKNKGICLMPGVNVVTNIGFGAASSHTKNSSHRFSNLLSRSVQPGSRLDDGWFETINKYEEEKVFGVSSPKTILIFLYFSVFNLMKSKLMSLFK